MDINNKIAEELGVMVQQVAASIALLDEGSTVPFISRYRKEATGGLDDLQLRDLEVRLRYLRELQERKQAIVASIAEQDKLTPELEKKINAFSRSDVYLATTKTYCKYPFINRFNHFILSLLAI